MTRVMIFDAQVPTRFWPEVVATSAYLLNRLSSKILNQKTPLQILATQTDLPPVQILPPRVFWCSVFVYISKANRTKFDPCAEKYVFVRYATHQKGYQCYNPITHRVHVTIDCDFLDLEYFFSSQLDVQGEKSSEPPSWLSSLNCPETVPKEQVDRANKHVFVNVGGTNTTTTNEDPSENVQQEVSDLHSTEPSLVMNEVTKNDMLASEPEPEHFTLPPRRNRWVSPDRYSPEHVLWNSSYPMKISREGVTNIARAFLTSLLAEDIPKTFYEASKKGEWREAMKTEMEALEKNETWEKCIVPIGKKPVGC